MATTKPNIILTTEWQEVLTSSGYVVPSHDATYAFADNTPPKEITGTLIPAGTIVDNPSNSTLWMKSQEHNAEATPHEN